MRIQSLALATTLTLLSSSAIVSQSYAQKGITLQPQSAWAVKRVNENTPDAYCALARRFNEGLILTLAQNERYETSIAIDFAQRAFDINQRYAITLDPGAGEQRQFKVKPSASGKAFVIRVGSDQKFMTSLANTGYLRVVLDNESYNFNLADIDVGQQQVDQCLNSDKQVSANKTVTPSNNNKEMAELRAAKTDLLAKLKGLENENEQLRLKAASIETQDSALLPIDSAELMPALKVASSPAVSGLMRQVESLKAENETLRKMTQNNKNDDAPPVKFDVSIDELARENQRLQAQLEKNGDPSEYESEIKTLTQRIAKLEEENLTLSQTPVQLVNNEELKQLESQILSLSGENDALRESLAMQSSNTYSDQEFSALTETLRTLENKNEQLNQRVAELMQAGQNQDVNQPVISELDSQNTSNIEALASLKDQLKALESESSAALLEKEEQIASLKADLVAAKNFQNSAKEANELNEQAEAEFKRQLSLLKDKNARLESELSTLSAQQASLVSFKSQIEGVLNEKIALEAELKAAQDQVADLNKQLSAQESSSADATVQMSNFKNELQTLNANLSEVRQQKDSLENSLKAKEAEALEISEKISSLNLQISELSEENADLKEKVLSSEMSENGQNDEVAALLNKNEELRKQLASQQSEQAEKLAALEETVKQLEQNNEAIQEQHNTQKVALEEELSLIQAELDASLEREQMASAAKPDEDKLAEVQADLEAVQNENEDLRLAVASAQEFNEILQADWSSSISSNNDLGQEITAIHGNDTHNAHINNEAVERLKSQNQDLRAQLESQSREYLALIRDFENLKQEKRLPEARDASVGQDFDALKQNNDELQNEVQNLRRQVVNRSLPEAREASLNAPRSEVVAELHRPDKKESLNALEGEINEAENISEIASIEPAAGESVESSVVVESGTIAQSSEVEDEQNLKMQNVIEDIQQPEDDGLNEAQRLERSLKQQIQSTPKIVAASEPMGDVAEEMEMDSSNASFAKIEPLEPVDKEDVPPLDVDQLRASDRRNEMMEEQIVQAPSIAELYNPNVDLAKVLNSANIALSEPVSLVAGFSSEDQVAYQWRSENDLYGSAHQKPIANINDFDIYVRDYLTMTEERCGGDFAIMPSSTEQKGQVRIDSYEIACVGAGVDSSASVVFFNQDGTFTVVAHEAPTENMNTAMDASDRIKYAVDKT